jgi:hypothetical protein
MTGITGEIIGIQWQCNKQTNNTVNEVNKNILDMFPGAQTILIGVDKVEGDNSNLYAVECLNSLMNASGLPLTHIALKPGCPLMLLYNIDPSNGLCNGTFMILDNLKQRVMGCCLLSGEYKALEAKATKNLA